jgi:hypothetical protein
MYYQRGNINISPCGIDGKLYKWFVTGPKYSGILSGKNSVSFDVACGGAPDCKKYCAIDTMELADITALEKWKKDKLESEIDKNNSKDEATQYNELVKQIIGELSANKCNWDSVTFTWDSVTFTWGVNNQPITVSGLSGFVSVLPSTNSTTKFCNGSYISTWYNITNDPSHPDSRKQSFLPAWRQQTL